MVACTSVPTANVVRRLQGQTIFVQVYERPAWRISKFRLPPDLVQRVVEVAQYSELGVLVRLRFALWSHSAKWRNAISTVAPAVKGPRFFSVDHDRVQSPYNIIRKTWQRCGIFVVLLENAPSCRPMWLPSDIAESHT